MQKQVIPNEVDNILKTSGNAFHSKVVKFLRDKGWRVTISPYYTDNLTGKPREIDIIASKNFIAKDFNTSYGYVAVHLFIECKYINNKTVIWFDKINKDDAIKRIKVDTKLEDPNISNRIENHHYLDQDNQNVAKLYSTKSSEEDIFYKALVQSLNATLYYKTKSHILNKINSNILQTLYYPIIICNGFTNLYKTDFECKIPEIIKNNFLLEVNYAYMDHNKKTLNEYFLIDIVSYHTLNNYLSSIETNEIKDICENEAQKESCNKRTDFFNKLIGSQDSSDPYK